MSAFQAAYLLLLLRRGSGTWDVDAVIDIAVVGVLALLVVWPLAIEAVIRDDSAPPAVRVVWAAYPVLDAVLVSLVLRAVMSGRTRTPGGALLVASVTG